MGDWISVKDGLPDFETVEYCGDRWVESEPVLAICDGKYKVAKLVVRLLDSKGEIEKNVRWETEREANAKVTHWMPLPDIPV